MNNGNDQSMSDLMMCLYHPELFFHRLKRVLN